MAKSRLVGSYPVIGIRPTIDGRRGALDVRGSLEDQTMNMAKSAAKLFEENLKYSNGEPVKVVIADTTIGRVGESAACADKFRKEGVDITLTVTPCWCYGAETMDMDPQTIKAVWGFNGTERASRHTENKTDRKKVNFNFKSLEESKRKCNNNSIIRKGKYSMKEIRGSPVREEE